MTVTLPRVAGGLVLGAALSLVAGCFYAYAVWDPPSNDWGNEKATTTFLLIPLGLPLVVVALWLRRPIGRALSRLALLGRAGAATCVLGALILPAVQLIQAAAERREAEQALPAEHAALIRALADLGAELRNAPTVVVEAPSWMTRGYLDRFVFRLAATTGKPVLVAEEAPDPQQPQVLIPYRLGACGDAGTTHILPATAETCLIAAASLGFDAWPRDGMLLHIDDDHRVPDQNGVPGGDRPFYPTLRVAPLAKPVAPPASPYIEPYNPDAAGMVWQNACSIRPYGAFPYARAVHWRICGQLTSLAEIADIMFGPAPTFQ